MRIFYPYNEILPQKKAHDVFIFNECVALARLGWDTTLIIGRGPPVDTLYQHYKASPQKQLTIEALYHIRKNNPLGISWNYPFFFRTQQLLERTRPDWVFLSVRKQGEYHLHRKIPGVRYLYEVHELAYYPNETRGDVEKEQAMLARADAITVTCEPLKEILLRPPYRLSLPIEVIPLAVDAAPLPTPPPAPPLHLMYVGQLYSGQGISLLLHAMTRLSGIRLTIIGGKEEEITQLKKISSESVTFLGYVPPAQIPPIVAQAHAFVAPFEERGKMPYVAHTKLFEYSDWGRPLIAPDMAIVREHFHDGEGAFLFEPNNPLSLAASIQKLQVDYPCQLALAASRTGRFTWDKRAQHYSRFLSSP